MFGVYEHVKKDKLVLYGLIICIVCSFVAHVKGPFCDPQAHPFVVTVTKVLFLYQLSI